MPYHLATPQYNLPLHSIEIAETIRGRVVLPAVFENDKIIISANSRIYTKSLGKRFQNYLLTYMYDKNFLLASIFFSLGQSLIGDGNPG